MATLMSASVSFTLAAQAVEGVVKAVGKRAEGCHLISLHSGAPRIRDGTNARRYGLQSGPRVDARPRLEA